MKPEFCSYITKIDNYLMEVANGFLIVRKYIFSFQLTFNQREKKKFKFIDKNFVSNVIVSKNSNQKHLFFVSLYSAQ